MCGPSTALKELNQKIQGFANTMTSEAKTVFGTANGVVNKIIGSVSNIINGGPSQAGYSANQRAAMDASAVEGGATLDRNLKGAAASAAGAIGGGNVPTGTVAATTMAADAQAAEETASAENKIEQADYEKGNENYWKAIDAAGKAPSTLSVAEGFNKDAMSGLETAQKSQQEMDTASNWWQPLLEKGAMAGLSMATGGLSGAVMSGVGNMSGDSSIMENMKNFASGAMGKSTPGGGGGNPGADSSGVNWDSVEG